MQPFQKGLNRVVAAADVIGRESTVRTLRRTEGNSDIQADLPVQTEQVRNHLKLPFPDVGKKTYLFLRQQILLP
ncbi:hypothetical protein D3C81_2155480 [compost metagenome]